MCLDCSCAPVSFVVVAEVRGKSVGVFDATPSMMPFIIISRSSGGVPLAASVVRHVVRVDRRVYCAVSCWQENM
jgi:precorrin isomerase